MAETKRRAKSRLLEQLQVRRQRHRRRSPWYRAAFTAVGMIITLGGIGLLVLPGPAFVLLIIGLGMLAMEFDWAEELLQRAVRHAQEGREAAAKLPRWLVALASFATIAASAGLAYWAIRGDLPWLPI